MGNNVCQCPLSNGWLAGFMNYSNAIASLWSLKKQREREKKRANNTHGEQFATTIINYQ